MATNFTDPGVDPANGLTLEGWALSTGPGSRLFGFSDGQWGTPALRFSVGQGFLWFYAGAAGDQLAVRYSRAFMDRCWHHVAVVLPPNWDNDVSPGTPIHVFVDGVEDTPVQVNRRPAAGGSDWGVALHSSTQMFGLPFNINIAQQSGSHLGIVDEVVLWGRALTAAEVAVRAEAFTPTTACPTPPPTPPPTRAITERCQPAPSPGADVSNSLIVRVLSSTLIVVVADPTEYLVNQTLTRCQQHLEWHEARYTQQDWQLGIAYKLAAYQMIDELRPPILEALSTAGGGITIRDAQGTPLTVSANHLWPNVAREMELPRFAPEGGGGDAGHGGTEDPQVYTSSAEVRGRRHYLGPFRLL